VANIPVKNISPPICDFYQLTANNDITNNVNATWADNRKAGFWRWYRQTGALFTKYATPIAKTKATGKTLCRK
jgi:hypothetical protein